MRKNVFKVSGNSFEIASEMFALTAQVNSGRPRRACTCTASLVQTKVT